jgi:hypothetical protein
MSLANSREGDNLRSFLWTKKVDDNGQVPVWTTKLGTSRTRYLCKCLFLNQIAKRSTLLRSALTVAPGMPNSSACSGTIKSSKEI